MTAAFSNSYAYDSVGNMTTRTIGGTAYTLSYDAENRMTGVSGGSISATFVYDAGGNRVKGTVNGTTTVYIAGLYEYQGEATTQYYAGPGGNTAMRRTGHGSNNGVFYLLGDHPFDPRPAVVSASIERGHHWNCRVGRFNAS